jgi:cytochrome c peroxidase
MALKYHTWSMLIVLFLLGTAAMGAALKSEQRLGRELYRDQDLSVNRNQSCASCHSLKRVRSADSGRRHPASGFVDPDNVRNASPVSQGSLPGRSGALNAPSVGYAAFSPFFHWDAEQGLYVGGQFWNGRARTLAEQAAGPFLNPDEMAMPSKWSVVTRLKEKRHYVTAFRRIYSIDLDAIAPYELAEAGLQPPPGVLEVYDRMTKAIGEFEKTRVFNRFTSKFDYVLAEMTQFTPQEQQGLALFEDKAQCSACHISQPAAAPDGSILPPLFTDFSYDNLGLPRNMNIPGQAEPDLGLGGRPDIAARDPGGQELGKHKVMGLRNIALTPPYGHNGVFRSLEEIMHFYNTRDILGAVPDNTDPGFGVTGWPPPEVSHNVNDEELGDLGLSDDEERAIVAFLKTLTDGYPRWGRDPNVPPGTPSPFAETPLPPAP